MGNKEFIAGNFQKAVELFSKAIELDPTNHVLYSNRSGAYTSLHQYEQALQDAEKTIELNKTFAKVFSLFACIPLLWSQDVQGYSRKGAAYYGMHNYKEAILAYRAGLEVDPSNATMKADLANAEEALKQEERMPFVFF